MTSEEITQTMRALVYKLKNGDLDGAYIGYRDLCGDPGFLTCPPSTQRTALKQLVLSKVNPLIPIPSMIEAFRSATVPLAELVSLYKEPGDLEMLGICYVALGELDAASRVFKEGLALERERDPGSNLCLSLQNRISLL